MTNATTELDILKINCGKCKLLCSVPPVSDESGGLFSLHIAVKRWMRSGDYYCGRCRPNAEPNLLFEDAAKKVIFPCRFACGDQLAWGQVEKHEIVCKKRNIICPFVNCQQSIAQLSMLSDHIKSQHSLFYQQSREVNQLEFGSLDFIIRLHCIRYDKYTFLFFIKFEHNKEQALYYFNFSVCLVCPQESDQTNLDSLKCVLDLNIPGANIKIKKVIDGKDIKMYQDRQHCLSCLYETCVKAFHKNKLDWLSDRVAVVLKPSSDRDIFYTIEVCKPERVIDITPDDLECPVCKEYMTDEIFICNIGHSLCKKCKSHSNGSCPLCRNSLSSIRNYALEKVVKSMKVSCRKSGCRFAAPVASVKCHEKECMRSAYVGREEM